MKYLLFPVVLWLLCAATSLPAFISTSYLLALLFSLSFTALCLYAGQMIARKKLCLFCLFYQIVCLLWPDFLLFLPMSVYLLLHLTYKNPQKFLYVTWVLPTLFTLSVPHTFVLLCLFCLLALLLAYSACRLEDQSRRFYMFQDDSRQQARLLEQKNQLLSETQAYQVQLATLGERNRIAREIHDHVGHLLTRSLLQIRALEVTSPQMKEPLEAVSTTLASAMDNIRSSVHDLHDQSLSLSLAIQALIDAFTFCPVTLRYEASVQNPALHHCFLSIIKEALSNIARHSNASHAYISVIEHPSLYQLIIEDNGTTASSSSSKGMGLYSIQERVDALQGILHITTNQGFRLFISIPKKTI